MVFEEFIVVTSLCKEEWMMVTTFGSFCQATKVKLGGGILMLFTTMSIGAN